MILQTATPAKIKVACLRRTFRPDLTRYDAASLLRLLKTGVSKNEPVSLTKVTILTPTLMVGRGLKTLCQTQM